MEGIFAPWHIAIVLVVALLIFGPKRLPSMGHSLGKSITGFRQGLKEASEEFSGAMKEEPEAAKRTEANMAGSPAPSAPAATAIVEPAIAEPAAETIEQPSEPSAMV